MKKILVFLGMVLVLESCVLESCEYSATVIAHNTTTSPPRDMECKIDPAEHGETSTSTRVVPGTVSPKIASWEFVWDPALTGAGGNINLGIRVSVREIGGSWSYGKDEYLSNGDILHIDISDSGFTLYR